MENSIRGILFDKDGTLLDYQKSWAEPNQKAAFFAAAGNKKLASKLLRVGGMNPSTLITKAGSQLAAGNTHDISKAWVEAGSPRTYESMVKELDNIFVEAAQNAVPVTGLASTIEELVNQGYVLGVASSDNEAAIEVFLEAQKIRSYFDFVAGYDSGHGHKPSPGMLMGFCAATNLSPDQVAVVGDNTHDLEMARSGHAGFSIGVLTGTGCIDTLSKLSDVILPSITKLTEVKNWQTPVKNAN